MEVEDFINKEKVVDLSFFNFENAITAAYYANDKLEIQKTNKNFAKFFPILGNVTNAYFPNVLEQLGIPDEQILQFRTQLDEKGSVLIPQIKIIIDGEERMFSLLSAKTKNDHFSFLNGVQGQFVDRTNEWALRREREELMCRTWIASGSWERPAHAPSTPRPQHFRLGGVCPYSQHRLVRSFTPHA